MEINGFELLKIISDKIKKHSYRDLLVYCDAIVKKNKNSFIANYGLALKGVSYYLMNQTENAEITLTPVLDKLCENKEIIDIDTDLIFFNTNNKINCFMVLIYLLRLSISRNKFDKAHKYIQNLYDLEIEDKYYTILFYYELIDFYYATKKYYKLRYLLPQMIELLKSYANTTFNSLKFYELKKEYEIERFQTNLAYIYFLMEDYHTMFNYIDSIKLKSNWFTMELYSFRGIVHRMLNQYENAVDLLFSAYNYGLIALKSFEECNIPIPIITRSCFYSITILIEMGKEIPPNYCHEIDIIVNKLKQNDHFLNAIKLLIKFYESPTKDNILFLNQFSNYLGVPFELSIYIKFIIIRELIKNKNIEDAEYQLMELFYATGNVKVNELNFRILHYIIIFYIVTNNVKKIDDLINVLESNSYVAIMKVMTLIKDYNYDQLIKMLSIEILECKFIPEVNRLKLINRYNI